LLVIDEVQGIGEHTEGERIAGALRTALTRHEKAVRALFTGSSETQLTKLFAQARASLYQFAVSYSYEFLDADFVSYVAHRFTQATRRGFNESRALEIMRLLGHQPEAFLSVMQTPLARADQSLDDGLERLLAPSVATPWAQLWQQATRLQQAVLVVAGMGLQLGSETGRQNIARFLGKNAVSHSSVQRAISALHKRGVIERATFSSKAVYTSTDPVFALWIQRNGPSALGITEASPALASRPVRTLPK
jgi:hypothetical protein